MWVLFNEIMLMHIFCEQLYIFLAQYSFVHMKHALSNWSIYALGVVLNLWSSSIPESVKTIPIYSQAADHALMRSCQSLPHFADEAILN